MSTLILSVPPFILSSGWMVVAGQNITPVVSESFLARESAVFGLSALPRGARVESAVLSVAVSLTGPGEFLVQGSPELTQDLTGLIYANASGSFEDLALSFSFRARITSGSRGYHRVKAKVSSAVLTVGYDPPAEPPPDEAPQTPPFSAAARRLLPRGILQYPGGARQVIGPESILSFRLEQGVHDGPLLGCACAAMLSVRLANAAGEWHPGGALRGDRPLLGAWLSMYLTGEGPVSSFGVPLGVFRLTEMSGGEDGLFLELRGYDAMAALLERPYLSGTLQMPLDRMLEHVLSLCGLPAEGGLLCNGSAFLSASPVPPEGGTLRQALANLCGAGGSFACVSREGNLIIRSMRTEEAPFVVGPDQVYALSHDERVFSFRHLLVQPWGTSGPDSLRAFSLDGSGPTGENALVIRGNPLFANGADTLGAGLKEAFTGASWQALTMVWRWDPSVVPGARLTVRTRDGGEIQTVLCGQTLSWDGGLTARAYCRVDAEPVA